EDGFAQNLAVAIEEGALMCGRMPAVAAILCLGNWLTPAFAQAPTKSMPVLPAPSKSLPSHQGTGRVARSFSAQGIEAVYLRAEAAEKAEVRTIPGSRDITVSGVPQGGAAGYHPPDPNWRETPAALWGFDFVARLYGSDLVISSEKEFR